jgi:hypothetical protein
VGTSRQTPPATEKPPPKKPSPTPSTIIPPSPSQISLEILGKPSSRQALSFGPVLEPLTHSSSPALEIITEDTREEESFHEVNQEEDLQELGENPSHELLPSKTKSVTYPSTHRSRYSTFKLALGLLSLIDTFLKFKDA